jgi:hypothetical protein
MGYGYLTTLVLHQPDVLHSGKGKRVQVVQTPVIRREPGGVDVVVLPPCAQLEAEKDML